MRGFATSPNIIRMSRSRRLRWAGHVARMGKDFIQGFWWESQKEITTRKT
jgi:hypothetical protein